MMLSKTTLAFLAGSLLFGCSASPLKVKSISKNETPAALAEKLARDIDTAKEEQVDALSPAWFARAQASLLKAQEGFKKGTDLSTTLDHIAIGDAQLQQAYHYAEKSKSHLKSAIKSRKAALKAGASQFEKEFAKLEIRFLGLTRAVENNRIQWVTVKKNSVDAKYRALELRAIKNSALNPVRQMLKRAKDEDMDEIAPKSFVMAQKKMTEADAFITRHRYAVEDIAEKVRTAEFYAARLSQICQVSRL